MPRDPLVCFNRQCSAFIVTDDVRRPEPAKGWNREQSEQLSSGRFPFETVSPRQEHREHDLCINHDAQLGGILLCSFGLFSTHL